MSETLVVIRSRLVCVQSETAWFVSSDFQPMAQPDELGRVYIVIGEICDVLNVAVTGGCGFDLIKGIASVSLIEGGRDRPWPQPQLPGDPAALSHAGPATAPDQSATKQAARWPHAMAQSPRRVAGTRALSRPVLEPTVRHSVR